MFNKQVSKHKWRYIPYFRIVKGMMIAMQVCDKTGDARYVRVPSSKQLEEMENARTS